MMLIVVALVAAGLWLIAPLLLPVILHSPWLNGLIGVVFVIGVLTCFWQVAQLMGSVSWIEGFASQRPGHEMTAAPQLLAPLAALLRSRGARSQISSSSARSILESVATRIDEARDITRYLTNLLIFLGLLGTLYGLATTVPAVVDTIRALAPKEGESSVQVFEKLMAGLEQQLGGMGTAFSSSMLGLAGSLVVGLLELFAGHGQNRFYRELEEWLSSFTRLSFASADADGGVDQGSVAGILDHLTEQMEAMQALFSQTDAARTAVNDRLGAVATALERVMGRIETDASAQGLLERIAAAQERMAQMMAANAADPGLDGGDAESRMRLRSIDVQLLRLLEEVAAGRQESMGELRADLAQLTRAVKALGHAPGGR